MENGKLCPNCGKTVPAGKAYCMSCGVSLGVKCPECGAVSPLGSKACVACGHSFEIKPVSKKKKKKKKSTLIPKIKKHANVIFPVFTALFAVTVFIFFFLGAFSLEISGAGEKFAEKITVSAPDALGAFFGAEPGSVSNLSDIIAAMTTSTFPQDLFNDLTAISYLVLLVSALLCALLTLSNIRHFHSLTSKRTRRLTYVIFGAAAVQFGALLGLRLYMTSLLADTKSLAGVGFDFGGTSLALLIITAVWTLVSIYSCTAILPKTVPEDETVSERGFKSIFFENKLILLIKNIDLSGKKKKGPGKSKKSKGAFISVTKNFTFYLIILGASLIFTQALVNVASYVLFMFVLIAPFVLLIYTLIAKSALTVFMQSDAATVEKNQPYTYEFRIMNGSILAYPFIDAVISLPQHDAVRCTERIVRISLSPRAKYTMKNTVSFRFRGTYGIGVKCFYVYDFFRIFKVRVDIENVTDVYVIPRKLVTDDSEALAVSDSAKRTVKSPVTYDKLEVSDVREYRLGDSLKSIHWKLSSKSEEFVVREYNTGTSNMTYIYCDLSARFPDEPPKKALPTEEYAGKRKKKAKEKVKTKSEGKKDSKYDKDPNVKDISDKEINERIEMQEARAESADKLTVQADNRGSKGKKANKKNRRSQSTADAAPETVVASAPDVSELAKPEFYADMNEYLADGIVELTVSAVLRELRAKRPVTLIWFDKRSDVGAYSYTLSNADDFDMIFKLFGSAPLSPAEKAVGQLSAMNTETDNVKQIFVTGAADKAAISDLCNIPGVSDGNTFGSAEVLLYNPEERFAHVKERKLYLESCREQLSANGLSLSIGRLPSDDKNGKEADGK